MYIHQHAVGMKAASHAHEVQFPATSVRAVETDRDVNRVGRATGLRVHRLEADIAAEWADRVTAVYIGKTVSCRNYLHYSPSSWLAFVCRALSLISDPL